MNKTLTNIKVLYDKMGASEKKIADFLFKNPSALLPLSISELAEASGSSEATIVGFQRLPATETFARARREFKRSVHVSFAGRPAQESFRKSLRRHLLLAHENIETDRRQNFP